MHQPSKYETRIFKIEGEVIDEVLVEITVVDDSHLNIYFSLNFKYSSFIFGRMVYL